MADELADLRVRIAAETGRFDQGLARSQQAVNRFTTSVGARLGQAEARFSRFSTRGIGSSRAFGNAVQQAGFQVGDFAVQVASGQSPMRAFIQQGTQIISVFGPWGAVMGAAGAVVGALAISLWNAGEAGDAAANGADRTADAMGRLDSALSGLTGVVDAYAAAIGGTANAQVDASDIIVAQTEREFNAKKRLLELEQKRAIIQQNQNLRGIVDLQGRVADLSRPTDLGRLVAQEVEMQEQALAAARGVPSVQLPPEEVAIIRQRLSQGDFAEQEWARKQALGEARDSLTELSSNADLLGLKLQDVSDALTLGFEDTLAQRAAEGGSGLGGGGGGGSSSRRSAGPGDPFAGLAERVEKLREEQSLIGLSEDAQARLTAEYERQRIVTAALNKIREEGREPTEDEIRQAQTLGAAYEELTVANANLAAANEAQANAAADAKRRQEELAQGISQTADRLLGAIQNADSFSEALRNVGIEMLRIAALGATGQGPLGKILGPLVNAAFAGFGSLGSGAGQNIGSGIGPGTGGLYAKGGAFSGGREIIPFARGGIVTRPTVFPMANGMGLMGEAGPEAVMPLARGPGGKLGVMAQGGGGMRVTQSFSFDMRGANVSEANMRAIAESAARRGIASLQSARKDDPSVLA